MDKRSQIRDKLPMPSFDIASEIDMQELDNAIQQARKEYQGRYDFRGSKAEIIWDKKILAVTAEDEYKLNALKDMIQSRAHKRGIDIRALQFSEPKPIGNMMQRRDVKIVQGIETEKAKEITKAIRDSKIKVQAQIQDEKVRVTGKNRDDLQACMAMVRAGSFDLPLQFINFRD
jgi:cyclic-di-GMP-binding protein